jgi:hypothetical protein
MKRLFEIFKAGLRSRIWFEGWSEGCDAGQDYKDLNYTIDELAMTITIAAFTPTIAAADRSTTVLW